MKTVEARIRWKTQAEGGRKTIPPGPRYSTVARFPGAKKDWLEEAWSLIVEYEAPVWDDGNVVAAVRFLADGAPEELLNVGCEFELLEGSKMVAEGVVLSERS